MHLSCFFFLLKTLFTVHFIFILDYRSDIRQKAKSKGFLFEFKMGCKAVKQLATSTMHLAQELLTNVQFIGGSKI